MSQAAFTADPSALLSSPDLACRMGQSVHAWAQAAPLLVALLAWGEGGAAALQDRLPAGFPILPAPGAAPAEQSGRAAARDGDGGGGSPGSDSDGEDGGGGKGGGGDRFKRSGSSWRGWLSFSWRSGSGHSGQRDAAAAAAVAEGGAAGAKQQQQGAPREGVPAGQEAHLLALAAEGGAASTAVTSVRPGRRSPSGRRTVVLKRRAFVPTPAELAALESVLVEGQNTVVFSFGSTHLRGE